MNKIPEQEYYKLPLFPNGMKCPRCGGCHFHPEATILPYLTAEGTLKGERFKLWVARSECLTEGCNAFLDWTFHPDRPNGMGNEFISIVEWNTNPLGLNRYRDFPRSKK